MKYSDVFADENVKESEVLPKELVNALKEVLKHYLTKGVVKVVFTKKDGTERVTLCTLSEEYLPESYAGSGERKKSEETLAVFDIEEDDWRSFRWDSIKEIKFKLEANYA